jgi:hypothetical protein
LSRPLVSPPYEAPYEAKLEIRALERREGEHWEGGHWEGEHWFIFYLCRGHCLMEGTVSWRALSHGGHCLMEGTVSWLACSPVVFSSRALQSCADDCLLFC